MKVGKGRKDPFKERGICLTNIPRQRIAFSNEKMRKESEKLGHLRRLFVNLLSGKFGAKQGYAIANEILGKLITAMFMRKPVDHGTSRYLIFSCRIDRQQNSRAQ